MRVIIVNGPMGVGKTVTGKHINDRSATFCISVLQKTLEIVPEDGHFAVTAMFHDDILFQQYIDITLRNDVDKDGNAVFYDLLLDVVVLRDGTPQIIDIEELEAALSDGIIKRDVYEVARQTAYQVVETWNLHKTLIEKKLYEYRDLF